ncbi:hypothetical protein KP509_08G007500 [Ceratopteris richardii]|nr:hypothetical protein KP509_08G007500 [Ceratopteris richardii]
MEEGDHITNEIIQAIKGSRVHIIILSPQFLGSRYCVEEVFEIIEAHKADVTYHQRRLGITVFYDVQRTPQINETQFDLSKQSRSLKDKWEVWLEALERISDFKYFKYDSKTTFQWETLQEIVAEVLTFLNVHNIRSNDCTNIRISRQRGLHDVFICHCVQNTQHNVVSVLRGMLHSRGIGCFVVGYAGESEYVSEVEKLIENSKVHVIFLSPEFTGSKQCLDEVVQIMRKYSSSSTPDTFLKSNIIPIFYDVEPTVIRYQQEGSASDLRNAQEITQQEREDWSRALQCLCQLKGALYNTSTTFQWETLYDICKRVEYLVMDVASRNDDIVSKTLYKEKISQVSRILRSQKAQEVSLIGVYGRTKSQFADVLVQAFRSHFEAVYPVYNVLEKVRDPRGLSNLVKKVRKFLVQRSEWDESCWQLLESKKCLVVIDDLGNNIEQIRKFLQEVQKNLKNGSLLVMASEFRHMLEDFRLDEFIDLSLDDRRGIVNICYGERTDILQQFLNHLEETFYMLGLDVRLLDKVDVESNSARLQDAAVLLCILSENFRISDFQSIFSNAPIPLKTIYVSYGSYPMDESTSNTNFNLEVNFDKSELDKWEFRSMINKVVQSLNGHEKIMEATDFPVGLAQRVKEIERLILEEIETSSERSVRCFGFVGMGGVGKTTLAMSVYNKLHRKFEKSCFNLNTSATVANDSLGLVAVQKNILANLLDRYNDEQVHDEVHGKALLSSRLMGISALIVLDDVDESQQMHALYDPLRSSLGPNSVVIITSRNKRILEWTAKVKIFDVTVLDKEMSERLFYWHAFMKPTPPPELEEIAGSVIGACEGLPLSLKVMGSHLYQKTDLTYWKESLLRLERSENKISEVLKISYDGLGSDAKEAFLDICCFLIGEEEGMASMILEACYGIGLSLLAELSGRCLISANADDDGKGRRIRMHDQIRDMGRDIIRKSIRNRAWDKETANNILQDKKARSSLRGLSITSHIRFPKGASHCIWLPELRILVVEEEEGKTHEKGLCPRDFFKNVDCGRLRWLRWRSAPFKKLPLGCLSTHIRLLDLSGGSEIRELPMDMLTNLRALDVSGCRKLKGLRPSIGRLTNLTYLNLSERDDITFLPQEMTRLSCLQQLIMNHCTSLKVLSFLPTSLQTLEFKMRSDKPEEEARLQSVNGPLPNLRKLILTHCPRLQRLHLEATSLRHLDLSGCGGVKELDFEGFSSLEHLNLDLCSSLTTLDFLPSTLHTMSLSMDVNQCGSLQSVNVQDSLPSLQELIIRWCPKLEIIQLDALSMKRLFLEGCSGLKELD